MQAQSSLRDKLPQRERADRDIHFRSLREVRGRLAGAEASLSCWSSSAGGMRRPPWPWKPAGEALLGFHRLEVPATLNVMFPSTNLIENVLRNWRKATGNVKRWNGKKYMIPRWKAGALLWADAGFRRIRHAEDLTRPTAALALST